MGKTITSDFSAASNRPSVTIVLTVRERFSLSARSLEAIYDNTKCDFSLVCVVGGAPKRVRRWFEAEAGQRGFRLIQRPYFLTPNESRNIGLAHAHSDYIVFIENDVIPSTGWIEALLDCAVETAAKVVAPLICEGLPMHQTIHQAGGTFAKDPVQFFAADHGRRQIYDRHTLQGEPVEVVRSTPMPVQTGEFHCVMISRDTLVSMGGFDEGMMSTREHLDFAMTFYGTGGQIILAPAAVVTFLMPWADKCIELADLHFHMVRWSPLWARRTINRFRSKWGIDEGQRQDSFVSWRYGGDIVKPLFRRIPIVGRSEFAGRIAARLLVPGLRLVGDVAASLETLRRGRAIG